MKCLRGTPFHSIESSSWKFLKTIEKLKITAGLIELKHHASKCIFETVYFYTEKKIAQNYDKHPWTQMFAKEGAVMNSFIVSSLKFQLYRIFKCAVSQKMLRISIKRLFLVVPTSKIVQSH